MKVVLTKCDLDSDLDAAQNVVKSMGMSEAIVVSSNENVGLDKLRNEIMHSLYGPQKNLIVSQAVMGQKSEEAIVSQIYDIGIVTNRNGLELTVWCDNAELQRLIVKSGGRVSIK